MIAAPAEIPASTPSRWAARRAVSSASSSSTAIDLVDHRAVEHLGDEAGADPLDLVRARARRRRAPARRPARPRRRSASGRRSFSTCPTPVIVPPVPTPATKASTSPSSVAPDLLGRGAPVDLRVGRVGELLRHEALALLADLLGELDRLGHPAQRRRLAHLGAVGAQQLGALAAHPLRQGEDQLVAARRADHRQRDPGVAAGRLDDHRAARLDQPLAPRRRRSSPPRSGP